MRYLIFAVAGIAGAVAMPPVSIALPQCGDPGTGCTVGHRDDMEILRPNRADAEDCLIDAELRKMDPNSVWLPENGHHVVGEWMKCPEERK